MTLRIQPASRILNVMRTLSSTRHGWLGTPQRPRPRIGEPPLRADLFSGEQLARHARNLAATHQFTRHRATSPLLARLNENERILRAFNRSTLAVNPRRRITPAAEWLLDNFYLIEEQIHMARRHLPPGYSRELPRLTHSASIGLPRVYDIVLELISHVDAQVDLDSLRTFINAYQIVSPLTLGELWAIPIMLRLGLIENLQRVTTRLTLARDDRDLADRWVDRLQDIASTQPSHLVIGVADMARSELTLSTSFVTEFCQRLSQQSPVLHLARGWLEQRLGEQGLSIDRLVHLDSQNQAADQVSVSHCIATLRLLSALNWKEFVESLSHVEQILRTDPSSVYPRMDFPTRDRYRHAVELLARHSSLSEVDVARQAILLASHGTQSQGRSSRPAHVGYYLIDKGRTQLGHSVGVRWPWRSVIERSIHRFPLTFYAGGIIGVTILGTILSFQEAAAVGLQGWRITLFASLCFLCSSQLAVAFLNWLSITLVKPCLLPRLDASKGIPLTCRTMVVVPTFLSSAISVDRLIETLEIHQLSNRDDHVHFALLTDFRDADQESLPSDHALLQRARSGIEMLNRRHAPDRPDRFFLFHRPRRWNTTEALWMGYERKRGKLMEFNALLRGSSANCFSDIVGDTSILPSIKYVITLDSDTQLPRDAARRLVGTMAHPLNVPEFDPVRGIVAEGYSILQPRVGVSLPSARRSWFVRLFAGDAGIDPYTREVSDVYQDVFQEGSFVGKGIYDVDAFQRAMQGRFPQNTILSHDLLEACHARSALVSDVEFYEDFPSRYNVDVDRRHRWIRGDWQITQWLLPRVPGSDARRIANPLSVLSQWKILDNLRRSLVPIALFLLLIGDWLILPQSNGLGLTLVLSVISLPTALSILASLTRKPTDLPWSLHLASLARSVGRQLSQILITLVFIPYDAFISLDAIGRTLLRLLVTRKRLLEWHTSSDSEQAARADLIGFYLTMWIVPALSLTLTTVLLVGSPQHLPAALPLLGIWFAAPAIAWWLSQPIDTAPPALDAEQLTFLRRSARRTWHFFETFVTSRENGLPPDNFQELPSPTIASRTSPTNMGLNLLANLAAHDFGYLSTSGLIQRTQASLDTMERLERFRGHFYNWYDTRTLQPLGPLYVSSVDSGNLAGHLLTLASGLREQALLPVLPTSLFQGLRDTVGILLELSPHHPETLLLETTVHNTPLSLRMAFTLLSTTSRHATDLVSWLDQESQEFQSWARTFKRNCDDHRDSLTWIAPWLLLPVDPANLPSTTSPTPHAPTSIKFWLQPLDVPPSLREIASFDVSLCPGIDAAAHSLPPDSPSSQAPSRLLALSDSLRLAATRARQRLVDLEQLALHSDRLATMDFTLLFDTDRNLFSIGFNVAERRCDVSYYDLLASEARLCSYVTIALGQVPQDHWFSMGRLLVASHGDPILVSWSGSMFEYLMPLLVMPNFDNTLLDHTCRAAVKHQIDYGRLRSVPWGISESGYNRTDVQLNYQYRAFGVPGLGLKRGLADDLVVAPYASAMALMIAPQEACTNLQRLAKEGCQAGFGFYEAVDYTPSHLPPGQSHAIIRSFMVHHQGMSLLSLANVLHNDPMPRRFMACPLLKAAELLLQERVPNVAPSVFAEDLTLETTRALSVEGESVLRIFGVPSPLSAPEVHLLSNGRYHVVITDSGAGYSRWGDLAITRWREDATRDAWGFFVFLRDVATGEVWSTTHQPLTRPTRCYQAIFTQARAEFRQSHLGLDIHTEICVSPEDDVELRRITLINRTPIPRVIQITSYTEVVLAPPSADAAHPAFSNLFVQTEFIPNSSAILCTRRASTEGQIPPWLLNLMVVQQGDSDVASCQTDRCAFIGRNRSLSNPLALDSSSPLPNTVGPVLDPVAALRRTLSIPANGTVIIDLILGASPDRPTALAQVEKYQNSRMTDRAFDLAWTHSQVTLRHLNATEVEAQVYGRLASALIYADPTRRANPGVLRNNRRGQSGLWSYGISGDAPIVLLRISDTEKIEIARQLIRAHSYWRMKGLTVELVIVNEDVSVYRQSLHDVLISLIASGVEAQMLDKPSGIFVRRLEQISAEDRVLLQSVARIVLDDENGSLLEQSERRTILEVSVPPLIPSAPARLDLPPPSPTPKPDLQFPNGLGGFTRDGTEYVITLNPGQSTPAPWVNVIANPFFGTLVSESGAAYTWAENAHEFRLTPWLNDPVQDATGEALYIRDDQTGEFWSPTPSPCPTSTPHVVRHGFGYSIFEHSDHGIVSQVSFFVAKDAPVKFIVVKLTNISGRPRRLSITGYWEWVLGDLRPKNLMHVQTEVDLKSGALLARNFFNTDFADRIAFVDVNDISRTVTGDRREFLGRNGSLAQPACLKQARLSGKVGPGLDPCAALQVSFDLPSGHEKETVFRLGLGRSIADVQHLIHRFRRVDASDIALQDVKEFWSNTLGTVQVETPDPAANLMANGWLLYQTLSSRLWGKTGFYQSGGAYGFRDQLQDVMALVHAEPALAREHLLRAASRQFRDGDVQHWWHPPLGRGVRTHFSDDFLWLPYAVCRYISTTGDTTVLDESLPFLESRPLKPLEEAFYDLPNRSEHSASLYQHCVKAIEHGLSFGVHGLPLMGCGDWNDGMNQVGHQGRGESVWLAFFLGDVLTQFASLASRRNDPAFASLCQSQRLQLQQNIEQHAWDGEWYRRAYFDNGDPLGSHINSECQIDSLPQSWSIISGMGDPERSRVAMASVDSRLVLSQARLIRLFDPPFDSSSQNPGYIKGYIPGVRENGGQYTHGAIWTAMAFALIGNHNRAWELFSMLNPILHASSPEEVEIYKVEPYVVAADVYAVAPHVGRGGWTWYTGSAGWMYRLLLETLLGIQRVGDSLLLTPRVPSHWSTFTVHYRFHQTLYQIRFQRSPANHLAPNPISLDGLPIEGASIPLLNDRQPHLVIAPL